MTCTNIDALFNIEDIGERIIGTLMLDYDIDEEKATDIFFSSQTFLQLSDESTQLFKKNWQEIYELLKQEL